MIRGSDEGVYHVPGHMESKLALNSRVEAGDPVGEIALSSGGAHLHWGVNRLGIWEALDTGSGWGRGPAAANREDAELRG